MEIKNTKYFHAKTIVRRRRRNKINSLILPNGESCNDQNILQMEATNFYKKLFSPNMNQSHSSLVTTNHLVLSNTGMDNLMPSVTKEEVFNSLNSMKPLKAPGPDGFHVLFFKQYWNIVGDDIWKFISDAFKNGFFIQLSLKLF